MEVYKPTIKKFLGKDVRVIQVGSKEYIIENDMFNILGLLDKNNSLPSSYKDKYIEFLININKLCTRKSFTCTSKTDKKKSRETREYKCLLLETVPIVLTQFKPSNRRKDVLDNWFEFMQWVDNLLMEAKAHEVILKDKEEQKRITDIITNETDHKMVAVNSMICKMMAELIGVYPDIKKLTKEELKIYQHRTTIDLIEVRQEALKIYEQQLIISDSKTDAYNNTLRYMKRIYKL